MNRFRIAGNQRMPPVKFAPFGDQPIRAGRWHPFDLIDILGCQHHAIGDEALAFRIIGAGAGADIKQPAGDIGEINLAGVFVFQF